MDFNALKAAIQNAAKKLGVTEYEIYYMSSSDISVDTLNNEISNVSSGLAGGLCLRLVMDGKMGYASTELMEEAEMENLVERAIENAKYTEKEADLVEIPIGSYVGMTVKEATAELKKLGITAVTDGGDMEAVIQKQMPSPGTGLTKSHGRVLLYTDRGGDIMTAVPDLIGLPMETAVKRMLDAGLNIKLSGTVNSPDGATAFPKAARQSIPGGTAVPRGTSITVEFLYDDTE